MKSYRESIIETVGELKYDSEIFFHESCIYMDVTYDLLSKGIDVWQQYDCWYTDKEVANIEQIVEYYVSKYIDKNINRNNDNNKIIINNNNITIVKKFADDKTLSLVEQALADDEEAVNAII